MKNLTWYYPETLEEVADLLKEPGLAPHGGGTGILRTGTNHLNGLIDLRHLPLFYCEADTDTIEIGAGLTYHEVVQWMKGVDPDSILVKSLSRAAATPLRNRITIGGSIAMAPVWSDLLGPLVALEAELILTGAQDGVFPVTDYVRSRDLRAGSLVRGIRIPSDRWQSHYVRAVATHFDYAGFTITVLAKLDDRRVIEDLRLVVVGNKRKYKRLSELEGRLVGQRADDLDLTNVGADAGVEFSTKTIGSPEYVRHLFDVELQRAIEAIR